MRVNGSSHGRVRRFFHPLNSPRASGVDPQLSRIPPAGALDAEARDEAGNDLPDRSVTWSSTDESVARVSSNGTVTGEAEGEATITATSEGVSGTAEVTVVVAPVGSVAVSPETREVQVGATGELDAEVGDEDGNMLPDRSVT
jgi:uncharacterized protein YjdB